MAESSLPAQLAAAASSLSAWELVAVLLGITYLLLAVRESLWCWYAAFVSTGIFLWLFWEVNLLMESALQLYYLAMAVYGWYQWRHGSRAGRAPPAAAAASRPLPIATWQLRTHLLAFAAVVVASAGSGFLLAQHTDAALPYLDSFTTWGSILTTWMVARKILENWLYWLVIDSASIYLYLERGLLLTAGLFAVYLIIVVFGYRRWLQQYRHQSA
ncbi:nicotinamide riboside transporter PnuC [Haliea sp. E1-2-M8]|uniref:nicotinamide riboside transporter PnuC n=1 Tax=Haliea sp. E1-2-M8 TaxID=3064706 RepID=UPI0027252C91|nr:nicotinamide riboside transporter PnuC [Haliea sp. E1-2-M8]MDO8861429.1 nicotinamide riboside transporter PnuC [Haliea sp. E1-2-M8]